ncbi:MAG: hypothetical protein Q9217_001283 [Psora testacea]
MATIKPEDVTELLPGIQTPSNCVDPLDIDQYINQENLAFRSPSISPNPSYAKSSTIATPTSSSQPFMPSQPAPQQTFSQPRHQYEQYKQQASLPVGAVANTFALNESEHFSYGQNPYNLITPAESYFGMNNVDDFMDFGSAPGQTCTDADFATPLQGMSVLNSTYISPSTVGGRESSPNPQPAPSQPIRAWPGMHQQQAAMQAKAQAEAQAQRQQHTKQQSMSRSRASSRARHGSSDPHVEESISRLLDRMRHSSVNSSTNDDDMTSDANSRHSHGARMRKDEEDMDEDERLLASEEGKKLSSKERRQLRNKVSARAFRSRRKEYIGQLEGEIAAKSAEADDLRVKNQALVAENSRLTDLTRMLLSSPHFSNFLNALSASGGSMPDLSHTASTQQQQQSMNQQQASRKDVDPNTHEARRQTQNNMNVGLAMIPESPYEHDVAESTTQSWIPSAAMETGLYDAQVYAVTSLPEEPVIDGPLLSGKSTIEPLSSFGTKDEAPVIERMPEAAPKDLPTLTDSQSIEDDGFDESDPALELYADRPTTSISASTAQSKVDAEDHLFGDIALEKAFGRLELTVSDDILGNGEVSGAILEKFLRISSRMETLGARVEAATAHLS